jgi:hypothetical protein
MPVIEPFVSNDPGCWYFPDYNRTSTNAAAASWAEPVATLAPDDPAPCLADNLTVIVCTSFTAACPATLLIEATLQSFGFVPGLERCRVVIVCDGYQIARNGGRRVKAGRLEEADVAPYKGYVAALRARAAAAAAGASGVPPALRRATVLELEGHHGFGWAVKAALESGLVTTRQVLVVQHDRSFMRPFDLSRGLGCMMAEPRVGYLLIPTRSTHHHAETMIGKGVTLPHLEVQIKTFRHGSSVFICPVQRPVPTI